MAAAAPDAPKPAAAAGTKRRKEPEPEADHEDEAMRDFLLADSLSSAAANLPQMSIPPVVETITAADKQHEADRELAEWMAATADQQWAFIYEWQAKLGLAPPPNLPEPYDELDPDRFDALDFTVLRPEGYKEKEGKRRLGRDGLVHYYL